MPIRVEQWDVQGRPLYRVIGVTWGGPRPADALQIRFQTDGPWIDEKAAAEAAANETAENDEEKPKKKTGGRKKKAADEAAA